MYIRKSVGPRLDHTGTQALTGYSFEDFPFRTTLSLLLLRKRLQFEKKNSSPNSIENLGCIKCYSSSSPTTVKSPSNSIRHSCQKICS